MSITIHSKRDPDSGVPLLNDCTLLTGEGPVVFKGGRAEITDKQAALLANHESIDLHGNGNGSYEASPVAPTSAGGPALPLGLQDANPDELDFLTEALNMVRSGQESWEAFAAAVPTWRPDWQDDGDGDDAPAAKTPAIEEAREEDGQEVVDDGGDPAAPKAEDTEVNPAVREAQEALRADGEHVPKVLPTGFEAQTSEGEPRCYARKADESQCTNPAKLDDDDHSTYACGLARHQEQVAKLP